MGRDVISQILGLPFIGMSLLSLGRCGKLAPIFCGRFEIMSKKGPTAYELALPVNVRVHNVFHASLLKKYIYNSKHFIDWSLL